tara:strand:+ start:1218 stop:1997 length:780 start_codon:yes stop_codon:yes gene_type:complete
MDKKSEISNNKKFKIDKMFDVSDDFTTKKDNNLFDLPMRLLMIAKTGDSKSTTLGNYLLKDEAYKKDFDPENIFIFSGSVAGDRKLKTIIEELDVPHQNIFGNYDNDMVSVIYDMLVEQYNEKTEDKIKDPKKLNSLLIFDDLAYAGVFKDKGKNDAVRKIFFNGRKFLVSCIIISQKYSSISTSIRENASGLIIGKASGKQLELISDDHNYLTAGKKAFMTLFRKTTDKPFTKFIINFSKPELYYNENFEPILNKNDL